MEDVGNFDRLFGLAKKTLVGAKLHSKRVVFAEMVAYLSAKSQFPKMDGESLRRRWMRFFGRYKDALKFSQLTGQGESEAD
jgi:hypothetical protein